VCGYLVILSHGDREWVLISRPDANFSVGGHFGLDSEVLTKMTKDNND
jgi:hypothetical protein